MWCQLKILLLLKNANKSEWVLISTAGILACILFILSPECRITVSQNHRIITSKITYSVQPVACAWDCSRLCHSLWHPPFFGNSSRDGDPTTSLGSLFQCIITLSEIKSLLISNLNIPGRTWSHYLLSYHCYVGEESNSHLLLGISKKQ